VWHHGGWSGKMCQQSVAARSAGNRDRYRPVVTRDLAPDSFFVFNPFASATAHALTRLTSGTETTRPSRNSTTSARSVTRTFRAAAAVAVGTFEVVMPCLGEFGLVL